MMRVVLAVALLAAMLFAAPAAGATAHPKGELHVYMLDTGQMIADCNQCGSAGLSYDNSNNLKVTLSSASFTMPLPGTGTTAAAANQSVGIQGLNGANMQPLVSDPQGSLYVNAGATALFPAVGTAPYTTLGTCSNQFSGSKFLVEVINEGTVNELTTAFLQIYDEASGGTCSNTNDLVYQLAGVSSGMKVPLNYLTKNGLCICWSTSASSCTGSPTVSGIGFRVSTK